MSTRREFMLGAMAGTACRFARFPFAGPPSENVPPDKPWSELPEILARIRPPVFPDRSFDVTRFGAQGDGKTDCTEAFHKAITACSQSGGGRVLAPAGTFLTGAIHLRSNVNLHVSSGAAIRFSRDPAKYLPVVFTRWEGMELMNYSPFIYAFACSNIAITGAGTLDGQSDCEHWWPWKGRTNCGWKKGDPSQDKARKQLEEMVAQGTPVRKRVFGDGSYLRPQFIQPYRCKNVLIQGLTLKGSPMWQVHPVLSSNVTIQDLIVSADGPNTDGCDPESCCDVLIKNCRFRTGDDCIALKSGRNDDGRRVHTPCWNLVIQGCTMNAGHGGITVGSEISGGVANVFAEDCQLDSAHLNQALRFKTNAMRGGLLEKFRFRNIQVRQVAESVLAVDFYYEKGEKGPFTPVVRDIVVQHLTSASSKRALELRGFKTAPITNVVLQDCSFDSAAEPNILENVQGLELKNVRINGKLVRNPALENERC